MQSKLAILAAMVISVSLVGSVYAHKAQVVGDYKIEVGWKNEPPIVGEKNAIEIVVTKSTSSDKKASTGHDHDSDDHDAKKTTKTTKTSHGKSSSNIKLVSTSNGKSEHKHNTKTTKSTKKSVGVTGLSKTLEADVTLKGKKTFLKLVEDKKKKGTYYGDYTPDSVGYPTVHIVSKIKNTPIEVTFHPEKVEPAK